MALKNLNLKLLILGQLHKIQLELDLISELQELAVFEVIIFLSTFMYDSAALPWSLGGFL